MKFNSFLIVCRQTIERQFVLEERTKSGHYLKNGEEIRGPGNGTT